MRGSTDGSREATLNIRCPAQSAGRETSLHLNTAAGSFKSTADRICRASYRCVHSCGPPPHRQITAPSAPRAPPDATTDR
jgi:hypothetical protein